MVETEAGLVRHIEARLRMAIIRGQLPGNAKLRQDYIAAEFGTTVAPVREALRRLENARLVISRPRRGVVVAPICVGDALEVAEMRAALEGLAIKLALPHAGPADVAAAQAALERLSQLSDVADWLTANGEFHMALCRPCRRPRLISAIKDLWLTSDRHIFRVWSEVDYQQKSQAEHALILAAYSAKDIARTCELLSEHILSAGETLEALLLSVATAAA